VVSRRSRPEGDVRADHADERATTHAGEYPLGLAGARPCGERIAIGFDPAAADDNDRVGTELRHGVMLGVVAERHESHVHAFGRADAKVGTCRAARLLACGTSELALGLDPSAANAERIGFSVLAIGDELSIADDNVLQRPDRRKLTVEWLALGEESQIETRFHAGEA
jgi:hypothetical protein